MVRPFCNTFSVMIRTVGIVVILVLALSAGAKRDVFQVTTDERQKIDGFGASDAWSFWRIGEWEDVKQKKVADWLFSSDMDDHGNPKGIALSIWRFNAGSGSAEQGDSAGINYDTRTDYYQKQKGQRAFLRHAAKRGVPTFLAFFNTPPVHLTQNGLGTNTGRTGTLNLREDCYDDFAEYAADMIEAIRKEDGVEINYLSPVNEPDAHWNWLGPKQEGSPATNREIARVAREMNRVFQERGIGTKVVVSESSDYRCMYGIYETDWQRGNQIQAFWNADSIDTYIGNLPHVAKVMAGHSYWTNTPVYTADKEGEGLYGYRKHLDEEMNMLKNRPAFWMTETCIMANDEEIGGGGGYDYTMEVALYVARIMHYDLTVANAQSWQWWRAAGGDYKDGLLRMFRHDVRDSKLLWTMGNFSRFIRPGAVRLHMDGEMHPEGVMMSAYRNEDGTLVVVAINYGKKKTDVRINIPDHKGRTKAYRTSDEKGENMKYLGELNMKKMILIPRSVTTIVVK